MAVKWSNVKARLKEYRNDIERLENEGGKIMPTLRRLTTRISDGYIFTYLGNNLIRVDQSGGTFNTIETFEAGRVLDTEQDFETEISFWLYNVQAI